jgi:multiple sugar transport system permease protein
MTSEAPAAPKRRFKLSMSTREALVFYLLISPWIFGFVAFQLGPLLASLGFSFTDYDVVHKATFLGAQNYRTMLFDDKLFWQSLKVTFTYAVMALPLGIAFALFLAVLLNQKIPAMAFFRTVFYMPSARRVTRC